MTMSEFGISNKKKILLIHGAGTSYKMWTIQIEVLSKEYHLYVPTLNGHVIGSGKDYISPKMEAEELISWFDDKNIRQVDLICGASLGANVVAEILLKNTNFAKYAFIESLKSYHYGIFITKSLSPLWKRILRSAASVTGIMEGSYQKKYASDDMKYILSNMTEESMNNLLLTTGNYIVPVENVKITAISMIVYGSKEEKFCRKNSEILKEQISNCQRIMLPRYNHGELSIGNPQKHIEMIIRLLSEDMVTVGEQNE